MLGKTKSKLLKMKRQILYFTDETIIQGQKVPSMPLKSNHI